MYGQQHTPAPGSLKALMGGLGGMEAAPQPAGYGMGSYAYSQGMWKLRRRATDVAVDWTEVKAVAVGRRSRVRALLGASGAGLVQPWGNTYITVDWTEVEAAAVGRKGRVRDLLLGASGAGIMQHRGSTGLVNVWPVVETVAMGRAAVDVWGGDAFCCTLLGNCCRKGQQRFPLQQRFFITVSRRWLHQNNNTAFAMD